MHYNIPPEPNFSAFNISTNTVVKCSNKRPQLILFVAVRYLLCDNLWVTFKISLVIFFSF